MKPQLDPVPIHEMPMKRWWCSPHHQHWYYHTPREEIVVPNLDVLEKTLDPCLKELAIALNRMGCITLPSCQGMHDNKGNAIKRDHAYDYLQLDAQVIRSMGLLLTDVETGETIVYYDPMFALPWNRATFQKKDGKGNKNPQGYLPFVCYNPIVLGVLSMIIDTIPKATLSVYDTHLGLACTITVQGNTVKEQCAVWQDIFNKLVRYA
jgi:hypothetical protein